MAASAGLVRVRGQAGLLTGVKVSELSWLCEGPRTSPPSPRSEDLRSFSSGPFCFQARVGGKTDLSREERPHQADFSTPSQAHHLLGAPSTLR